ncbi:hypothetical protein BJ138DRAFT_1019153, partial [Hygrophoropsis aurantiaca]
LALLYYDYCLTFPLEVKYIWGVKFKFSTALYICCRYALLANLLYLLAIAHVINKVCGLHPSCNGWYAVNGYLSIVGRAAVLTVFAARTWAVCGRSTLILAGMGSLGVLCIAFDFWHVSGVSCSGPTPPDIQVANTLLSITVCVFECIGTAITSIRCLQALRVQKKLKQGYKNSIMFLMLKEGIMYFCGVFAFTFTAVVLNFEEPSGFFGRLLNALTLPISGLLSARLLLHLREWADQSRVSVTSDREGYHAKTDGSPQHGIASVSFHAATVGRWSGTDEFGGDPVEDTLARRDFDLEMNGNGSPPSDITEGQVEDARELEMGNDNDTTRERGDLALTRLHQFSDANSNHMQADENLEACNQEKNKGKQRAVSQQPMLA